jgi:hypothetical protein
VSDYKERSGLLRVPLGDLRVKRGRRPYLDDGEFALLLDGDVTVEEKLDGTPRVLELNGDRYYCEDLRWRHSIAYVVPLPTGPDAPPFWVCYDVLLAEGGWAGRARKERLAAEVGLPVVPVVFEGRLTRDDIPRLAKRSSAFGGAPAEGVVIKNFARGMFGKFVNREFELGLEDALHWRRRKRVANRLCAVPTFPAR